MDFIMVLNDGETYTTLCGCKIVGVPEKANCEEVEEALKSDVLPSGYEIITIFN